MNLKPQKTLHMSFHFFVIEAFQKKYFFLTIISHINTRNEDHKILHTSWTESNTEKNSFGNLTAYVKMYPGYFQANNYHVS